MPLLIAVAGVLTALAYWYFRVRDVGKAASEVVDVVQRAKGAWNRRQFRNKADESAITAITDPVVGAAVLMVAVCQERGRLTDAERSAIKAEIRRISGTADPDETLIFAEWATEHVNSANDVTLRLAKLWSNSLTPDELRDLVATVIRVARIDGDLEPVQDIAIRRLKERLGIAG